MKLIISLFSLLFILIIDFSNCTVANTQISLIIKDVASIDTVPVYNNKGEYSATNDAGGRYRSCSFKRDKFVQDSETFENNYFFGGLSFELQATNITDILVVGNKNDLWSYNTDDEGLIWVGGTQLLDDAGVASQVVDKFDNKSCPSARNSHVCWLNENGNLYLFGGDTGSEVLNDVWEYDVNQEEWRNRKQKTSNGGLEVEGTFDSGNFPSPRYGSSMEKISVDKVGLFGGFDNDLNEPTSDFWIYTMTHNVWSRIMKNNNHSYPVAETHTTTDHPPARYFATSWYYFFQETKLISHTRYYIFGGYSYDDYLSDVWFFDLNEKIYEWYFVMGDKFGTPAVGKEAFTKYGDFESEKYPSGRMEACSTSMVFDDFILVVGGVSSEGYLDEFWIFKNEVEEWTFVNGNYSEINYPGDFADPFRISAAASPLCWKLSSNRFLFYGGKNVNDTLGNAWEYTYCSLQGTIDTVNVLNGSCTCNEGFERDYCLYIDPTFWGDVFTFFEKMWDWMKEKWLITTLIGVNAVILLIGCVIFTCVCCCCCCSKKKRGGGKIKEIGSSSEEESSDSDSSDSGSGEESDDSD